MITASTEDKIRYNTLNAIYYQETGYKHYYHPRNTNYPDILPVDTSASTITTDDTTTTFPINKVITSVNTDITTGNIIIKKQADAVMSITQTGNIEIYLKYLDRIKVNGISVEDLLSAYDKVKKLKTLL